MQALQEPPPKISDIYLRTWQRIVDQNADHAALAQTALLWVLHSKRPMRVAELLCAVATCPETHRFEADRLIPFSTIIDLCHGLLVVPEAGDVVQLSRKS